MPQTSLQGGGERKGGPDQSSSNVTRGATDTFCSSSLALLAPSVSSVVVRRSRSKDAAQKKAKNCDKANFAGKKREKKW